MSLSLEQRKRLDNRRAQVRRLYRDGLSITQISQASGVSSRTVINDLRKQGLYSKDSVKSRREQLAQNRRELIADLVSEGLSTGEICERTGFSRSLVGEERRALGLKAPVGGMSESRRRKLLETIEARRTKVKSLYSEGVRVDVIASTLGVSTRTIRQDIKSLDLSTTHTVRLRHTELLEELRWLIDGGTNYSTASKQLGVSEKKIKEYCREIGLAVGSRA